MSYGKQKRVVSAFLYRRTLFIQYQKSGRRNTYPMDIPNWKVSIQAKKRSSKFGDALIS
jgi:hypothetical protein